MAALTALLAASIFFLTYETRDIGLQEEDQRMVYLAEAGVERALRELRDDYLTNTETGTAQLRAANVDSVSVTNADRALYEEDANCTINDNGDSVTITTFDANYTHTKIVTVSLGVLADRASGGTGATIEISYSTDGTFPQVGNSVLTQALTTTPTYYYQDVTADRTWTWATIMGNDFTLRARRTAGNRNITLDYLFLRVTYEMDSTTEPWSTGTYETYPKTLGSGTIQTVSIDDEQGKVHVNTASQALLRYLMGEYGTADGTANTVATNIVNYRATNKFDTVEELQQVTGLTSTIYNTIKDHVTVTSYINPYAQGPAGARAPVNINTAPREVLEAVFDPLTFNNSSDVTNLASDIITQRNTAPFTCFYSSDTAITTDFYDFVRARAYLSNAEDDRVLGNADASELVPREGGNEEDSLTTEFSYDSSAFKVESVGRVATRDYRIKTILGDTAAKTFANYDGDTTATGYRRENFE